MALAAFAILPMSLRAASEPVAAPAPKQLSTPLGQATMARSLKAAAAQDGVPLAFMSPEFGGFPRPGDFVVAWVGTSEPNGTAQWLVQLRRRPATAEEAASNRGRDVTKYVSWGSVVRFKSEVEALEVWLAGPVTAQSDSNAAAPVQRLRVLVPGDYLRLGLDGAAMVDRQIGKLARAAKSDGRELQLGHIYWLDKPVKPENIRYAKPVAEELGITPEVERAWVGGGVALNAFYRVAEDSPPLRRIAELAVAKPRVWKLAKLATGTMFKGGVGNGQSEGIDPAAHGLLPVAQECFKLAFGMSFGEDPMVFGEMVVTSPTPPLDVSAGILALVAINPKDNRKMVHVVLVAAGREGLGKKPPGPATTGAK